MNKLFKFTNDIKLIKFTKLTKFTKSIKLTGSTESIRPIKLSKPLIKPFGINKQLFSTLTTSKYAFSSMTHINAPFATANYVKIRSYRTDHNEHDQHINHDKQSHPIRKASDIETAYMIVASVCSLVGFFIGGCIFASGSSDFVSFAFLFMIGGCCGTIFGLLWPISIVIILLYFVIRKN